MNTTQSSTFAYDDFEHYLLEAAKVDEAPADLPARLGVALGLGVPILVASNVTSLLPTTTSLSAGSAANIVSTAVPKGFLAALKASLGVGASTLWNTAAKGIAVGLLAGGAVLGTSQAVVKVGAIGSTKTPNVSLANSPQLPAKSLGAIGAPTPADQMANVDESLPAPPAPRDEDIAESAGIDETSSMPEQKRHIATVLGADSYAPPVNMLASETDKPRKRRARRVFPEKTSAIARYPLLYDDVSAFYDSPKKVVSMTRAVPAADPGPTIDPAVLASMRKKTLDRSRILLGQSKAALALGELDNFRARVGERNFGVDELLLRIEALAAQGRAKEAQADVAKVQRLAPNSSALRQAQQLARSRFVR